MTVQSLGNGYGKVEKEKDKSIHSFSIIKHFSSPNSAVTADGYTVKRQDTLYFEDGYIKCAPYDTHFIYDDPGFHKGLVGRWTPMCTCGSPAGIVGYNAYKHDASPTTKMESLQPGEMIVCLIHAQTGRHADGVS